MLTKKMISGITFLAAVIITVISAEGAIWTEPDGFDFEIVEGTALTTPLTIGNSGATNLNFTVRTRLTRGQTSEASETPAVQAGIKAQSAQVKAAKPVLTKTKHKSDQIIVRFRTNGVGVQHNRSEKEQIMKALGGGTVKRESKLVPGLSIVKLAPGQTVENALIAFNGNPDILYAEPDYEVRILSTIPNDPRFGELWGMNNTGQTGGKVDADIDAPEAWDIWQGSGEEIVIGVIDTGVDYTHPDLAANMWKNMAEYNGLPGVDDDGNGYIDDIYGYDFVNGDGDPMDDHYHGTHCAGTIGGAGNNGLGVAGVCWNIKIMAIKFLDSGGGGWNSDAILSVEYSVMMGAKITSNSWGGGDYDQGLKDAIDAAGAAGGLFVAAAGNSGQDSDVYPMYPAAYDSPNIISVMATDSSDLKASFSNYGLVSVDLGAPGVDILSCSPGGGYRLLSGTSMATPHVSGACGLLWSFDTSMTNQELKDMLLEGVDPTLTGQCVSGGRLNVFNSICLTKVPWITVEPDQGVVGAGGTTVVNVIFDALGLEPGTYNAEILVTTNDPGSSASVPVTMTVKPDALVVSPQEDFESTGSKSGPFMPASKVYTLSNEGSEPLNWEVLGTADWLEVVPNAGVIEAGESADVTVSITAQAESLEPNVYGLVLTFKNADSGSVKPRNAILTVKPPDMFTESFDGSESIGGLTLTLRPNLTIAGYEACRDAAGEFPTDPNGGTYLALGDDDYAEVAPADGKKIWFYGERYDRLYVGSNGYITFGSGDTEYTASLENHFSLPRISGYFADLTPATSQSITFKQLEDRLAITYLDVPIFGDKVSKNSFQIEIFFADGIIRITWLNMASAAGIAGISQGKGLPPEFFEESDLDGYPICWPLGDYNKDYIVDIKDLSLLVGHWLEEGCCYPMWCGRTDIDYSNFVDGIDYSIFAENWWLVKSTLPAPVAWWKFDEGTGTTAYDSAGDHDGQLMNGPTWTAGQIDGALLFDGTNDYVNVANAPNLNITGDITISAWILLERGGDGSDGSEQAIVTKTVSNGAYNNPFDFRTSGINPGLALVRADASGHEVVYSTAEISLQQWHHVLVRVKNKVPDFYLDGVLTGKTIQSFTKTPTGNTNPLLIGRRADGLYLDGGIDDVRIYNVALSADEIGQLYREGLGCKAYNPNPADGQTGVDTNAVLKWTPGREAASHDIYFGTDYNDVNEANRDNPDIYMGNIDVNTWNTNDYDSNGLETNTMFYWRIDEVGANGTIKGNVWAFRTEFEGGFVSWWKFDEGTGTIAYDSVGDNDGQLMNGPMWTTGKIDGALSFDGTNDYVTVANNDSQQIKANQITLGAWIWLNGDIGNTQRRIINKQESVYKAWGFELFGNGYGGATGNQVVFHVSNLSGTTICLSPSYLSTNQWYHVAVTDNAGEIRIYVNGQQDKVLSGGYPIPTQISAPINISKVNPDSLFYFNGVIDDVRFYNAALSAEEIEQIYREGLSRKATNPNPVDGQTGVDANAVLNWTPGRDAASHDIYFGTDYNEVNEADRDNPDIYMGNIDVNIWNTNDYDSNGLEPNTSFYWRIDEAFDAETVKGDVWSFTTETGADANLVSWWKFDEGTGTIAHDSAGNNDGQLINGPTWTTGYIDGGLRFDDVDDYINVPDNPSLRFTQSSSFSIGLWVNPTTDGYFISKMRTNGTHNIFGYSASWNSVYKNFGFVIEQSYITATVVSTPTNSTPPGNWYHVVFVYQNKSMKIYLNGQLSASGTFTGSTGTTTPDKFMSIGVWTYDSVFDMYFGGTLDDIKIYNRALTATEAAELYQSGF